MRVMRVGVTGEQAGGEEEGGGLVQVEAHGGQVARPVNAVFAFAYHNGHTIIFQLANIAEDGRAIHAALFGDVGQRDAFIPGAEK